MARKLKSDKPLFIATLVLLGASVVMVYSASAMLAMDRFEQADFFLFRQATWVVAGSLLLWGVMRIDYRELKHPAVMWTGLAVTALALIAVLFSTPINGTRRWFGIAGLGVQPSELAKLMLIIFAAAQLEREMARVNSSLRAMVPLAGVTLVATMLILLQPDFGTAMAILVILGAMVFAAGLHYRYVIGVVLLAAPVLRLLIWEVPYRRARLTAFLDPWEDPLGGGFQVVQSLIAVGTGGIFGQGLMRGVQKLFTFRSPTPTSSTP